jgi:hypothetical protein
MPDTLPTVQDFYNAKVDADDLAEIVNGGVATDVTTRYGGDVPTIKKILNEVRLSNSAYSFQTLALLNAAGTPADITGDNDGVTDIMCRIWNDATLSNNGLYGWNGTAWVISTLGLQSKVEESNIAAAVSGKAVVDYVAPVIVDTNVALNNSYSAGLSEKYPNLYDDPTGGTNVGEYKWGSNFNPVLVNNRPAQKIDATYTSQSVDIDDPQTAFPSGFITAGALWFSKLGGGRGRQLLLQFNGATEIERTDITFDSSVVITEPTWHESVGVVLNAATTLVRHYFDANASDELVLSNFCIADGSVSGFRKPDGHADKEQLAFLSNIAFETTAPNLVEDAQFQNLGVWNDNVTLSKRWDNTINKNVLDLTEISGADLPYQKIVIGTSFDGATVFNWSATLVDDIGTPAAGGRIFVIQANASGTELSRTEVAFTGLDLGSRIVQQNIAIEATLDNIEFYVDAGGTAGAGWTLTDLCLRKGTETRMGPNAQTELTQINLFSDPDMSLASIFGTGVSVSTVNSTSKLVATSVTATAGARWYQSAVSNLAIGSYVFFSCQSLFNKVDPSTGNEKLNLDILFTNEAGSEISRISKTNNLIGSIEFMFIGGVIPALTTTIQIRPTWSGTSGNAVTGEVSELTITLSNPAIVAPITLDLLSSGKSIAYISSLGSDSNLGTASSPVLSLNKAGELLKGTGVIKIINDGIYDPQTIDSTNAVNLHIMGDGETKPHIRGGDRKTGWTLEAGESNVWHTTTAAFDVLRDWIWEGYQNDAATFITDAEREPQHKGRLYRLEHTKLRRKADLATLKSESHGFWYDTGAGELYIKPANVYGDIETAWITYPTSFALTCPAIGKVVFQDIVIDFAGFKPSDSGYVELYNVEAVGALGNGLTADDTRGLTYDCRWAGSGNDGQNFHNTLNTDIIGVVFHLYNTWSHDARDDGDSMHEHCVGYYAGGLYEYNEDRGCAPSYGSHTSFHTVKTKYNGYLQTPSTAAFGEGIALVGFNEETGSYGTSAECFNCIDVGSNIGFANQGSDDTDNQLSSMKLYSCRSESSVSAAYSARNAATLELRDCTEYDTQGVTKYTESGGVITSKNATLVS